MDCEADFAYDYRCPAANNLGQAVLTVARLGGWFPNPSHSPPGTHVMRHGYRDLVMMALRYRAPGTEAAQDLVDQDFSASRTTQ